MSVKKSSEWIIRRAVKEDAASILHLIRELAKYEKEPLDNITNTVQVLEKDGFGSDSPWFECLVVQIVDGQLVETELKQNKDDDVQLDYDPSIVAYALFHRAYSTWHGRKMWLEDLYVQPDHRKNGIGQALIKEVVKIAESHGCTRIDWAVLDWNTLAKDFYKNIGVEVLADWRICVFSRCNFLEFRDKQIQEGKNS